MRAVRVHKHGLPQQLQVDVISSTQTLGPNEVVLGVHAAAVNFPDVLIIQGKYQMQPSLPFSPGSEVAGVVLRVGDSVKTFSSGDRVIAVIGHGGFAEEVVVDEQKLIPLPDSVSYVDGSALLMTYGTALYALRARAALKPGEVVLIVGGAGGVGIAAIHIAKLMGAKVIAAASTAARVEVCLQAGADSTINYTNQDIKTQIKNLTHGRGVDVILDSVGDRLAEPAIRSLAWNGRYLVVGFAGGSIPKIPLNLLLLKGGSAVGVFWGAHTMREPKLHRELTSQLLDWTQAGKIKPLVSATYPLEHAANALQDMMDRKIMGKAVIVIKNEHFSRL